MERSLDQVREIIYNLPKYIPITRIPPANRAFYFHMLPVYLQINTWKHLWQLLEFDKFGFSKVKTATAQRSLLTKNMHRNTCFRKWSAVARNQIGQVYCVQIVRTRNLGCHVLNFANVVVNVVTIAVKYAVLPRNALFTFVLRLRKSWWVLPLFS